MTHEYFSDRESGARPRTQDEIPLTAWGGLVALIGTLIEHGAFGREFPEMCPDGRGTIGTDSHTLSLAVRAEIPELEWPLEESLIPPTMAVMDLLEFCHSHVAEPVKGHRHTFFGHYHLTFDHEKGQRELRARVNRIFARNRLAYQFGDNGQIIRLAPTVLRQALPETEFKTGDPELDLMLETAKARFLDPDPLVRRESLEKLWDAWERLKTLEPAKDKRESVRIILDRAAPEKVFRETLEKEAKELTLIGNSFQIRHSETTQTPVRLEEHVEYLFHRLFAMVRLLLRARGC